MVWAETFNTEKLRQENKKLRLANNNLKQENEHLKKEIQKMLDKDINHDIISKE